MPTDPRLIESVLNVSMTRKHSMECFHLLLQSKRSSSEEDEMLLSENIWDFFKK